MKIETKTMLITAMTHAECDELEQFCKRIALEGYTDMSHPIYKMWCDTVRYSGNDVLLVYATVFPLRGLISVLNHRKS